MLKTFSRHCANKCSTGINLATVLTLTQSQIFVSFSRFASFLPIKIGAADISALFKTTKAPKKWQNDAKRVKRSKCLALALNSALALHFAQCQMNVMNVPH